MAGMDPKVQQLALLAAERSLGSPTPTQEVEREQGSMVPAMFAQDMQPFTSPTFGQGVSQFLTGQMGIPMQFGVDSPAYEPFQFSPGDFAAFMRARDIPIGERSAAIPVFDSATGTYTAYESKSPKS
jgi:hypothetical protein